MGKHTSQSPYSDKYNTVYTIGTIEQAHKSPERHKDNTANTIGTILLAHKPPESDKDNTQLIPLVRANKHTGPIERHG